MKHMVWRLTQNFDKISLPMALKFETFLLLITIEASHLNWLIKRGALLLTHVMYLAANADNVSSQFGTVCRILWKARLNGSYIYW